MTYKTFVIDYQLTRPRPIKGLFHTTKKFPHPVVEFINCLLYCYINSGNSFINLIFRVNVI